jgi:hypothetical protein
MQHYAELETEIVREEGWNPEEDTTGDFQCADSLAIAVNRIGSEGFRVKKIRKLLLRSFSALNRTDGTPRLLVSSLLGKRKSCGPLGYELCPRAGNLEALDGKDKGSEDPRVDWEDK